MHWNPGKYSLCILYNFFLFLLTEGVTVIFGNFQFYSNKFCIRIFLKDFVCPCFWPLYLELLGLWGEQKVNSSINIMNAYFHSFLTKREERWVAVTKVAICNAVLLIVWQLLKRTAKTYSLCLKNHTNHCLWNRLENWFMF